MKLFRIFTVISILIASSFAIQAQEFEVPKNISLEEKEDFAKYKADALRCIDWLATTPVNNELVKRDEANRFLLTWLAGTNETSVDITIILRDVVKKNPDLLMTFMGAWAKYELSHPSVERDVVALNKAAILGCIQVYEFNLAHGFRRNKKLEKLKTRNEKGTLENWISKKLKLD